MGKRAKTALRGVALISVVAASAAQAADAPAIGVAPPISPPSLAPAPLGVFGDALPGAGNLLITLSPQFVGSAHSLIGTQGVSPQQIVATTPWYWGSQVPAPSRADASAGRDAVDHARLWFHQGHLDRSEHRLDRETHRLHHLQWDCGNRSAQGRAIPEPKVCRTRNLPEFGASIRIR